MMVVVVMVVLMVMVMVMVMMVMVMVVMMVMVMVMVVELAAILQHSLTCLLHHSSSISLFLPVPPQSLPNIIFA